MLRRMLPLLIGQLVLLATPASAQWYSSVDFFVSARHANSNTVFQRGQVAGPPRVSATPRLTEDDVELDFAPGGRITLGNRTGEFGFEGSYLITDKWQDTSAVFDNSGQLASPFSVPGAPPNPLVDNNISALVDYTTQLQSAEANFVQRLYSGGNGDASLLLGARYMGIDESLVYTTTNAGTNNLLTTTDNQIIGPQLGALLEAPMLGGIWNFTFKFALGYNSVEKTTLWNGALGAGSEGTAALVSEVGVNCTFYPTENLSIRLGYHLLAASQVALATDNFESNLNVLGSGLANVETDSGVAYHSPYIGIGWTY